MRSASSVRTRSRWPSKSSTAWSPALPDYCALGAEHDGRLAGWICWGPTPCTLGTYDLYWMAVDPALHGGGIGTALLRAWSAAWRASPG